MTTHIWYSGNGVFSLTMTLDEAQSAAHQGQCDDDVQALSEAPHIATQLAEIDASELRHELQGFGAWDESELADHELNLQRMLWLAAGYIAEQPEEHQIET